MGIWIESIRAARRATDRRHLSLPLFAQMNLLPVRHRFDEPELALETHQPQQLRFSIGDRLALLHMTAHTISIRQQMGIQCCSRARDLVGTLPTVPEFYGHSEMQGWGNLTAQPAKREATDFASSLSLGI